LNPFQFFLWVLAFFFVAVIIAINRKWILRFLKWFNKIWNQIDAQLKVKKTEALFIIGLFLIALANMLSQTNYYTRGFDFNPFLITILYLLGIYAIYLTILELSTKATGIKFPNAYKIVLAIIAFFAIGVIVRGFVSVSWYENAPDLVKSFFDGIISVLNWIGDNLEGIKDFLEWWKALNAPIERGIPT
jgi:hypothetical protein